MSIYPLQEAQFDRWDEFVERHADGTFFHLAGWKTVLEQAFDHQTYFLYAESDGELTGVLPLARLRSRFFGDSLVSIPFGVYGGILSSDEESRLGLEHAACELATELGVDCLEMRSRSRMHTEWPEKELYVTFRRELDPDPDVNLKRIPRRQRAMVRRGAKAGLIGRIDRSIDPFYGLYAESVRNLGTPVFSRRYFRTLVEVFGARCEILTVHHEDRPVSGVMSFFFRDEVLPYYGGGTRAARGLAANDFMYWDLMRRACTNGVRVFDYGRSKRGTGSYRFKKHWGFEPEALHYQYYLVKRTTVPNVNPLNPKYAFFVRTWKRLPLPIANTIGPWISRHLG